MGLKKKLKKLGKKAGRVAAGVATFGGSEVVRSVKKSIDKSADKVKKQGENIAAAEREAATQGESLAQQAISGFNPFRQAGVAGLESLTGALGLGGKAPDFSAITNSPAYQFLQEQGTAAVRNQLPPSLQGSGREAKELARFSSGLASQQLGGFLDRASNLASAGAQAQGGIGELLLDIAKKRRQGLVGSQEAIASGVIGAENQKRSDIAGIIGLGTQIGGAIAGAPKAGA